MSKPDTSAEAVEMLARFHATSATFYDRDDPEESGGYARGVATASTLRALLAERDAAIAALDEAIRMMGEASRQAGRWQGISEGKDIALRQLEAERDAAREHVESERDIIHMLTTERDAARGALRGLLALRERTEADHESAYYAMFKSDGSDAWEAAYAALKETSND